MRKEVLFAGAFASGLLIGAGTTYLVTKSKIQAKADADIADVKAHFKKQSEDEIQKAKEAMGIFSPDDREATKAYLARLDELKYMAETNDEVPEVSDPEVKGGKYTAYNQVEAADAALERVGDIYVPPIDDAEELRVVDEEVEDAKNRETIFEASIRQDLIDDNDDHPRNPYIIRVDEFFEDEVDFEKITLSYFKEDDTLIDERDMPIPDVEGVVGSANLKEFGNGSKDDNIVYIRNERLKSDFEVTKEVGTYAQHLMESKWENEAPVQKNRPKRMREDG